MRLNKVILFCLFALYFKNIKCQTDSINVTPDPFYSSFNANIYLVNDDTITIIVTNSTGVLQQTLLTDSALTLGYHSIPFSGIYLQAGIYYVSMIAKGHTVKRKVVNLGSASGIEQYNTNNNINVYPNPNNGSFVIETNSATKQTLQVYDVNGKLVLSQIINGRTSIDASSLNEGVYNISLQSNEGVINKKLVIVK